MLSSVLRFGSPSSAISLLHHGEDAGDALAGIESEQRHAHGGAAGDAHLVGRQADQAAGVGHQHDVIALAYREARGNGSAGARRERDVGDALAAAAGDAILVGAGALAETGVGDGEEEFFGLFQFADALRRQFDLVDDLLDLGWDFRLVVAVAVAAAGDGAFQVVQPLLVAGLDVAED